ASTSLRTSEDPLSFAAGDANLYRYVFNTPTVFTDPSGQVVPLLIFVGVGITLAGVGGTIWATSRYEYVVERYLSLPLDQWTPELEADFHTYIGRTDTLKIASEVAGWTGIVVACAGIFLPAGGAAGITGHGMTKATIMRAFFQGQALARTEANIAALLWYLEIARNALARYEQMGYTGPGVATQLQRIEQILRQLARWGVAP
ncbi:MAG: hypothetical protein QXS54_12645, partial [Candidatus Methanomethylicaceae archaeon]